MKSNQPKTILLNPPYYLFSNIYIYIYKKKIYMDLPGGTVNKNPLANAGDTGLIPGPERFHMALSN